MVGADGQFYDIDCVYARFVDSVSNNLVILYQTSSENLRNDRYSKLFALGRFLPNTSTDGSQEDLLSSVKWR